MKLYDELARWWLLLSPPEDYVEEVPFFLEALQNANAKFGGTLLELGSGGGSNAFHLKRHFTLTLTDLSPQMLDVSRTINPECEHIVGDMRTVRVGRQFDVVFIHDAVDYMTTEADLKQAIGTAFVHCKPGGAALFVPDHTCENFEPSTDCDGREGGDGRALSYLESTFDPDPTDSTYTTDYAFMLREGDAVHMEHDRHIGGLFSRADWIHWLTEAGFHPQRLVDTFNRDVFVATRPASDGNDKHLSVSTLCCSPQTKKRFL